MKPFTTYQVSKMLHADITTIIDWIELGKLKAYKTPGGHRRVKKNDLIEFLKKYNMPLPESLIQPTQKKVLIVDDDKKILEFISRAIKKFYPNEQIKIETTTEGFIAGKRIVEFKPNLLILDIRLPGMDGFEVLRHLKCSGRVSLQNSSGRVTLPDSTETVQLHSEVTSRLHIKNMKILAITAYPSKETEEKILKAGADDYLVKPFTIEQLKEKIEKLM